MVAVRPPAPGWSIEPVDGPRFGFSPGLVPAQVWFQPAAVVTPPQSMWDPQYQADSCDANRAEGSSKHMERRYQPSAFMEKTQPSQNQARTKSAQKVSAAPVSPATSL